MPPRTIKIGDERGGSGGVVGRMGLHICKEII
jgi:hypothetical protein